jgi:SNF2 family DNA or RNA helicase
MIKNEESTTKGGLTREVLSLLNDHCDLDGSSVAMTFNNLLMKLRKICNHPFLFLDDITRVPDELYNQHVLDTSGKLVVLNDLVDLLLEDGHKV